MPTKFFCSDPASQSILERILDETWASFPQIAPNQIAATWIIYEPPYRVNTGGALSAEEFWQYRPKGASYRGVELIDPAGIASLFYLVATHVWLEQGMISTSAEIDRAIADMMTQDSSDAASYIVDVLSGTTSGPELPSGPSETWQYQRNIVNRYFQQLGWPELRAINLNQKVWGDRPYGRERDFLGEALENRNLLSTEATARLLHSIIGGVSVSSRRSQAMMSRMKTTAATLPANMWSFESRTHSLSHSAAYIESDSSHPYQLVVFVENKGIAKKEVPPHAKPDATDQNEAVVSFISQRIFEASQQAFQV